MNMPLNPDREFERRFASRLMDVLIRAGLIVALTALCYRVFSPFLTLMVWALILAVAMYPLHLALGDIDAQPYAQPDGPARGSFLAKFGAARRLA